MEARIAWFERQQFGYKSEKFRVEDPNQLCLLRAPQVRARYFLAEVQKLYKIEADLREQNADYENRKRIREEIAMPILESLGMWLKDQYPQVLPKSAIGQAIAYSLSRWQTLSEYIHHGMAEIDNAAGMPFGTIWSKIRYAPWPWDAKTTFFRQAQDRLLQDQHAVQKTPPSVIPSSLPPNSTGSTRSTTSTPSCDVCPRSPSTA